MKLLAPPAGEKLREACVQYFPCTPDLDPGSIRSVDDRSSSPLSAQSLGALGAYGGSRALDTNVAASKADIRPSRAREHRVDVYFSADVETDGPIPGPFSLLSFALVYAGRFDGHRFERPSSLDRTFYRELRPISDSFEPEALKGERT